MASPNLQIRFPDPSVHQRILARGGASWARSVLKAAVEVDYADDMLTIARMLGLSADELRQAGLAWVQRRADP